MGETTTAPLGLAQADRSTVVLCSGWALLAIAAFLIFSVVPPQVRMLWFPTVVSLLKVGAFLISTALCWRNAQDDSILSGQVVWQAIALGMAFYALGDITVILWRSLWGITSVASLGIVCYAVSYIFLSIGLLNAVLPRQINLSALQSVSIAVTGLTGIVLACWLNFYPPEVPALSATTESISIESRGAVASASAPNSSQTAPAIIQLIDQRLSRVSNRVGLLYVVGDCVLLVLAAALLVAFWEGTYAAAWKLIALAGLCLYIADMFLIYEVGRGSYTQGAPWEIFWILSALFFGLGAGVERGISVKMQRKRSRQRWL